jgi:hypothetical protein
MGRIALSHKILRLKGGFFILSAASARTKTIIAPVQDNKRSASSAGLVMTKPAFFYIHV